MNKKNLFVFCVLALVGAGCSTASQVAVPSTPTQVKAVATSTAVAPVPTPIPVTAAPQTTFDVSTILPAGAREVNTVSLDINGDGVMDTAVFYTMTDRMADAVDAKPVVQQRFEVYVSYKKNGTENAWSPEFGKAFANDRYSRDCTPRAGLDSCKPTLVPSIIVESIRQIRFSGNSRDMLLVTTHGKYENGSVMAPDYFILGDHQGKIEIMPSKKGETSIQTVVDWSGHLLYVEMRGGQLVEAWGGTCEGSSSPCYTFEFTISYDEAKDAWTISKASKIQKVESGWNEYVKENPKVKWTGKLEF